jgi:hypothetical protein
MGTRGKKVVHKLHRPAFSAWAQWVQGRATVATLNGDIHGDHWDVLRQILPLYQAITTVDLGDGTTCSFWSDVWTGDESLADTYPALFSHCTHKQATVSQMFQTGLQQTLVPRLSHRASLDLPQLLQTVQGITLTQTPDIRKSFFSKGEAGLDSGAFYRLLMAKGQPDHPGARFVWDNHAPPRVQLFMWLLVQGRIKSRSVLHTKKIVDNQLCEVCNDADETPQHIISGCPIAAQF